MGGKFEEEKKVEKKRVKPVASEGDAVAGKGRFGRDMVGKLGRDGRDPTRPCPWNGRADCSAPSFKIEPAEPETPPAHSLGKVFWRGTGGEGGGKTCFFIAFFIWRGWWLDLFFHRFFDIFGRRGQEKSTKIAAKVKTEEKTEK